jgi:DNA-binding transcriptional regulator PaaX
MSYLDNPPGTLSDLIFGMLGSARSARRFSSIISERKFNRYKRGSVDVALSRLSKKDYVKNSPTGWALTRKGRQKIKNDRLLSYISSPFKESAAPNIIISFDIPQGDYHLRNWLRSQIKIFGYKMLQQSLWIGPGPLPQSFLKRLKDLGIRSGVKIFRIKT